MASGCQGHETRVATPGHANLSGFVLPTLIFEEILLQLPIDDVHHCMSVCKTWYEILHKNGFFWKAYVQKHYDLTQVNDIRKSGLVGSALSSWEENEYYCYGPIKLAYIFKPFPKLLKCDIIVGAEYNPMEGMVSERRNDQEKLETTGPSQSEKIDYHNLAVSISILQHLLKRSQEFGCTCPAYGNEGDGTVLVWLAPQQEEEKESLGMDWVLSHFNANPELNKGKFGHYEEKDNELFAAELNGSFGMDNLISLPAGDGHDFVQAEEDCDEDIDIKNRQISFQKWLQRLYSPSYNFFCGLGFINAVLYFYYTTLAPGYVGGIMSHIRLMNV